MSCVQIFPNCFQRLLSFLIRSYRFVIAVLLSDAMANAGPKQPNTLK